MLSQLQGVNHDLAEQGATIQKHHSTLKALVDFVNGRNKAAAAPAKSDNPPFATNKPAAKTQTQQKPAQNRTQRHAARPAAG